MGWVISSGLLAWSQDDIIHILRPLAETADVAGDVRTLFLMTTQALLWATSHGWMAVSRRVPWNRKGKFPITCNFQVSDGNYSWYCSMKFHENFQIQIMNCLSSKGETAVTQTLEVYILAEVGIWQPTTAIKPSYKTSKCPVWAPIHSSFHGCFHLCHQKIEKWLKKSIHKMQIMR